MGGDSLLSSCYPWFTAMHGFMATPPLPNQWINLRHSKNKSSVTIPLWHIYILSLIVTYSNNTRKLSILLQGSGILRWYVYIVSSCPLTAAAFRKHVIWQWTVQTGSPNPELLVTACMCCLTQVCPWAGISSQYQPKELSRQRFLGRATGGWKIVVQRV